MKHFMQGEPTLLRDNLFLQRTGNFSCPKNKTIARGPGHFSRDACYNFDDYQETIGLQTQQILAILVSEAAAIFI